MNADEQSEECEMKGCELAVRFLDVVGDLPERRFTKACDNRQEGSPSNERRESRQGRCDFEGALQVQRLHGKPDPGEKFAIPNGGHREGDRCEQQPRRNSRPELAKPEDGAEDEPDSRLRRHERLDGLCRVRRRHRPSLSQTAQCGSCHVK